MKISLVPDKEEKLFMNQINTRLADGSGFEHENKVGGNRVCFRIRACFKDMIMNFSTQIYLCTTRPSFTTYRETTHQVAFKGSLKCSHIPAPLQQFSRRRLKTLWCGEVLLYAL